MITYYYNFIITYRSVIMTSLLLHYFVIITSWLQFHYYIIIKSLLHHYYVIVTSLSQMAKLCNNESIITYYYIDCFHLMPLLPIITIVTYFKCVWDRATCRSQRRRAPVETFSQRANWKLLSFSNPLLIWISLPLAIARKPSQSLRRKIPAGGRTIAAARRRKVHALRRRFVPSSRRNLHAQEGQQISWELHVRAIFWQVSWGSSEVNDFKNSCTQIRTNIRPPLYYTRGRWPKKNYTLCRTTMVVSSVLASG